MPAALYKALGGFATNGVNMTKLESYMVGGNFAQALAYAGKLMSSLRQLIHEIHRRSLWQVLMIYLGASWAVMEVTDQIVGRYLLPEWVYPARASNGMARARPFDARAGI